jgi:4-hydroxybenzoate polyprenyltransferase
VGTRPVGQLRWNAWLRLGRVSNLPTVWSNVLAGAILADAATPSRVVTCGVAASLLYLGGTILNDAYDQAVDQHERPGRPIPSGTVRSTHAFAAGYSLLACGVTLFSVASLAWSGHLAWTPPGLSLLLAGLILIYDYGHQTNRLGPVLLGACRALLYVTTGTALGGRLSPMLVGAALVLGMYVACLSWIAKDECGSPVPGWRVAVFCLAPMLTAPLASTNLVAAAMFAGLMIWTLHLVRRLAHPTQLDVPKTIGLGLAGICLLDGVAITSRDPSPELVVMAFGGWALTRGLQRWVPAS